MSVKVENLSFGYEGVDIFSGVSFEVGDGQVLCLLGPNGAGKSTLIKCIARILVPRTGSVSINGKEISRLHRRAFARQLAYIPQSGSAAFPLLVRDVVAMGRTPHKKFFSSPGRSDYRRVSEALAALGIEKLEYKVCTDLSGGERQMVSFATAIVQDPQALLLDEPTSHLDFGNQMKVLKTVKKLAARGISVIMATHAPEQAFLAGSQAAILIDGTVRALGAPREVVTEDNISRAFGVKVEIIDSGTAKGCIPILDEED
jgi:iron complex transport system ATP-binding protein